MGLGLAWSRVLRPRRRSEAVFCRLEAKRATRLWASVVVVVASVTSGVSSSTTEGSLVVVAVVVRVVLRKEGREAEVRGRLRVALAGLVLRFG